MTRLEGSTFNRRRGQTLAEFALTLPILLLLIFGIIEFGRIFQAWVTLQNAARAAARYATTGQYDESRYQLELNYYPPEAGSPPIIAGDVNSIVPCVGNDDISTSVYPLASQRGTRNTSFMPNGPGSVDVYDIYTGGIESIYATWNGGDDCDPSDPDDQARRKDMARLLSIIDEARRGAVGLGVGPTEIPAPTLGSMGTNPEEVPWYYVWYRPFPGDHDNDPGTPPQNYQLRGSNVAGWFDVMICSSRVKYLPTNNPNQDDPLARRFSSYPPDIGTDPRMPVCVLEESPPPGSDAANSGWTYNAGNAWMDAGGPGDTVNIVVTFNHPLITPLGLASYLPLQARRAAVNESFRAPRAVPISGSLPDPDVTFFTNTPTNTDNPNTNTPTYTASATSTPVPSSTASRTPTNTWTPLPDFDCDMLTLSTTLQFSGTQVLFTINNTFWLPVLLHRVDFNWQTLTSYPSMGVNTMQLGGSATIWSTITPDTSPSTVVGAPTSEYPFNTGASLTVPTGSTELRVTMVNGPGALFPTLQPYRFDGTVITLNYNGIECDLQFNADPPPNQTEPPPPTAVCTPGLIRVSAVDFSLGNGIAYFDITNSSNTPASLVGFSINWMRFGSMALWRVSGGGASLGTSLLMWENAPASGDTTPPTLGGDTPTTSEGTWYNDITVAPNGTTSRIYVQFLGAGPQPLPVAVPGVRAADFNGTSFYFDIPECVQVSVDVPVDTVPPPTLTPSRTNTSSRTPTFTRTYTYTRSNTPTHTRTLTPSNTYTRSNTPTASRTYTPSNTRTFTRTATRTFTRTATRTFTRTYTRSITPTASRTPTFTRTYTRSNTPTATNTRTATRTFTRSLTPTRTNTRTATFTRTNTRTATATFTRTNTRTATATFTRSNTPTSTRTFTRTNTATFTRTATASATRTQTATATRTRTRTPTPTETEEGCEGCSAD